MTPPLHVLVIDDSAVVRQTLLSLLTAQDSISVAVAPDPVIALDRMERRRPDVIVLDLEMPRMDGLTFLRKVMASDPIPVVVCSGHVEKGSALAMEALEEGAVEVIARPRMGIQGFLYESAVLLVDAVRAAAASRRPARTVRPPHRQFLPVKSHPFAVVAIGASTGGTEAIRTILEDMSAESCGVVVVQHMPEIFTRMFAQRLDTLSAMHVKEAETGDVVRRGVALIAPGNRHMILKRHGVELRVELNAGPLVARHRPSVDVLFRSVAETAGATAAGVLLTGMGADGAAGLLEMRRAGALTIAQDAASSVVFGMPREAIAIGAATQVLALDAIAAAIA